MSENENKLENLDNIFTKNVIQVTDEKSTVDIFWDTTDTPETAAFVHKNNMKILAMCIGRMIDDVGVRNIVLYDVAAHGDWEKSTIDSIYCIGSSNKLLTLYYIALGKINMKPQQLIELKSFRVNAIDAAITFDGEWVLNNSSNVFSLKTEDVPWIFYITYAGKLYRKYGTAAAAELTAENVKLVAAERGYSPQGHLELNSDQGLVVTYLKNNGELVYRSYAFASTTGQKEWFSEEIIDTFNPNQVQNISIHRLNDYRMGICVSLIENEKYKNLWYISDRSYAQMAFRPEKFFISNAVIHNPIYGYVNYDENNETLIQPKWDWSINEEHDIVTMTSDLPLVYFNDFQNVLAANGGNTAIFTTQDATSSLYKIEAVGDYQIKIYFASKLLKDFTLTFNPPASLDFAAKVNCKSGGGLVKINTQESHLFDISEKIKYNYNENFKISNATIDNMSVEMHYISTTKFSAAPETFTITNATVDLMNVKMHTISNIEATPAAETFTITNAVIDSITVDSINIIITVPI